MAISLLASLGSDGSSAASTGAAITGDTYAGSQFPVVDTHDAPVQAVTFAIDLEVDVSQT